jgi:AcrR family transcriptional regulator
VPGRRAPEDERREEILRAAFAVAAREGLGGLTVREVAAKAGVSSGLVFFHFHSKDALLAALLEWLLARTFVAAELERSVATLDPVARLLAAVRRDLEGLRRAAPRVELFFDYWVRGTRDPAIRPTIRAALERYRAAFVPLAEAVVQAAPSRFPPGAAPGLATVVASVVEGGALRAVLDPHGFDVEQVLGAVAALLRPSAPIAATDLVRR